MKKRLKKLLRPLLFTLGGALAGLAYYYLVGCSSGSSSAAKTGAAVLAITQTASSNATMRFSFNLMLSLTFPLFAFHSLRNAVSVPSSFPVHSFAYCTDFLVNDSIFQ